ncbi:MAG TPA: protein translocase subunit SecF [Candidatus Gastranaerophilaceae bacterium]|nr:protein translocase subunit SecF [Candidatus Gastranaerophilaceae bacterium]HPT41270.1 protein translocase subunit SecF [Candidatus Gastranaerophilaceae bacterium]
MSEERKYRFDLVKYRIWWIVLSAFLVLPGVFAMIYSSITYPNHAPLKVGIDYTGGTILQYSVDKKVTPHEITELGSKLEKAGIENPYLQNINVNSADKKSEIKSIISIRTKFIDEKNTAQLNKVSDVVKSEYTASKLIQVSSIGPTLGKELFKNSLFALVLACLGIVIYLTIRFQLDFAIAAVLSLLHDALFVMGCFSILGLLFNVQIDGLFITAILTVIGFSVHDTIVVFDRIRENLRYYAKKMSFGEIVNFSVDQTLVRSINTSLTTLITLLALYFFGGVTTKDFVLAMILGIAIGTYSSIFFASIVIDFWRERKSKK